ncbi:MAG TPA: hypothetical protein PKY11_02705, partial [Kiritimatiellia bacterium]|nr:hypothetical protein [Kiritimatiellia bacterium]
MEKSFPQCGKIGARTARFFHAMEKLWGIFPHNGKTLAKFSTQWKNFDGFFHTMENRRVPSPSPKDA